MSWELTAEQQGRAFLLPALDGVQWETETGSAGRLSFSLAAEGPLLREGARILLREDGRGVFCGYLFSQSYAGRGVLRGVAYDQLRYLKNRDTLSYQGLTASALLLRLAAEHRLACGQVEETGYRIPQGTEEDTPYLDMLYNALEETRRATGRRYVLYDSFGLLCLRQEGALAQPLLLDGEAAEEFLYESSLEGAYNQVKLLYEDGRKGCRQVFLAKDEEKIQEWGLLQYFAKEPEPLGAREKAAALLAALCRRRERLTVKNALGSPAVQAGACLQVSLPGLGAAGLFSVESARHVFREGSHTMDLTLKGVGGNG